MLFKLIHFSKTISLLEIKIQEPARTERDPTNRTTFNLILSSPLNTFTRTHSDKTRLYGEHVWFIKDCTIKHNDSHASVKTNTIRLQKPKSNSITQLTPLNSRDFTLKSFFEQINQSVKPDTHIIFI